MQFASPISQTESEEWDKSHAESVLNVYKTSKTYSVLSGFCLIGAIIWIISFLLALPETFVSLPIFILYLLVWVIPPLLVAFVLSPWLERERPEPFRTLAAYLIVIGHELSAPKRDRYKNFQKNLRECDQMLKAATPEEGAIFTNEIFVFIEGLRSILNKLNRIYRETIKGYEETPSNEVVVASNVIRLGQSISNNGSLREHHKSNLKLVTDALKDIKTSPLYIPLKDRTKEKWDKLSKFYRALISAVIVFLTIYGIATYLGVDINYRFTTAATLAVIVAIAQKE